MPFGRLMSALLLARVIYLLNTTQIKKRWVSHCTFYGVSARDNINLEKRFLKCLKKYEISPPF